MQLDSLYAMDAFLGYPVFRGKECKTVQRILLEKNIFTDSTIVNILNNWKGSQADLSSSTFQSQAVWSIFLASF